MRIVNTLVVLPTYHIVLMKVAVLDAVLATSEGYLQDAAGPLRPGIWWTCIDRFVNFPALQAVIVGVDSERQDLPHWMLGADREAAVQGDKYECVMQDAAGLPGPGEPG